MNIAITGATGFIGSHITDELINNNHSVFVLTRKGSSLKNLEENKINVIEIDYSNKNLLKESLKGIDIIIHCAGALFGKNYDYFRKSNVESTINLVESVKDNSNFKQFIFISSLTAAGPSASLDLAKQENDLKNPLTNYGKSKAEAEDYIESQRDWLNYTILRLPAVYGPRDTAIFSLFKLAKSGFGMNIGFSTKYLSLIHSKDVVQGLMLSLNNKLAFKKIYFLSSDEFYSWSEVFEEIKKAFNKKIFIKFKLPHSVVYCLGYINGYFSKLLGLTPIFDMDKAKDFTQKYWICSNNLISKELGFTQKITLSEGIKQTINWYKDNKWL